MSSNTALRQEQCTDNTGIQQEEPDTQQAEKRVKQAIWSISTTTHTCTDSSIKSEQQNLDNRDWSFIIFAAVQIERKDGWMQLFHVWFASDEWNYRQVQSSTDL